MRPRAPTRSAAPIRRTARGANAAGRSAPAGSPAMAGGPECRRAVAHSDTGAPGRSGVSYRRRRLVRPEARLRREVAHRQAAAHRLPMMRPIRIFCAMICRQAEQGFRSFVATYPEDRLASNAYYWLGRTHFANRQFEPAAKAFLAGYKKNKRGWLLRPTAAASRQVRSRQWAKRDAACSTLKAGGQAVSGSSRPASAGRQCGNEAHRLLRRSRRAPYTSSHDIASSRV